jgi:16S rRNA (guanine966-N2)-methyltransferase
VARARSRGLRLSVPVTDDVRPTKDRVREAVFSALDSRGAIVGATVLDLYAGTGAMAIEALSRGADRAVLVEQARAVAATARLNVDVTGFAAVARVETRDVATYLKAPPREAPFDLVCCDPPYEMDDDALGVVLRMLADDAWLAPDGIVVVERAPRATLQVPDGLRMTWDRRFGDTLVWFLER